VSFAIVVASMEIPVESDIRLRLLGRFGLRRGEA
jgi:hypothetical protein